MKHRDPNNPEKAVEDVHSFAAGALANLQLYRAKDHSEDVGTASGGKPSLMSKRMAKILRRKPAASAGLGEQPGLGALQNLQGHRELDRAAMLIQATWHGARQRKLYEQQRARVAKRERKGKNKYGGGDAILGAARAELEAAPSAWSKSALGGVAGQRALPGILNGSELSGGGIWDNAAAAIQVKRPARLAPLQNLSHRAPPLGAIPPSVSGPGSVHVPVAMRGMPRLGESGPLR